MAGLLAAELDIVCSHGVGDVRVADGGDFCFDVIGVGPVEKTLIRHDGDGDTV